MVWSGMITLKKSCFYTQLHLIDGSPRLVDNLKDVNGKNSLTVRQRLKMDPVRFNGYDKLSGMALQNWKISVKALTK